MRYRLPEKPKRSAEREVRKFLVFPKKLSGEIRWLEYATIAQKWNWYHEEWRDYEWINK